VEDVEMNPQFWKGKRVFLTGHTGFKGGWLTLWLNHMGAHVFGFSLAPSTNPSLFEVAGVSNALSGHIIGDVRDADLVKRTLIDVKPDIVIHMAAQPLVFAGYSNPIETYAINVMGTVNVLDAIRSCPSVRAALVVTTDKCYENKDWDWGYRENDQLGGFDPYSSSKACAELVCSAYRNSFFNLSKNASNQVGVASARAGNVIGGGDWSPNRLIPDALAAFSKQQQLVIRSPGATRPWQHVLEPLSGYMMLIEKLHEDPQTFGSAWNFGPNEDSIASVESVVKTLAASWGGNAIVKTETSTTVHEASKLKLDSSKAHRALNWVPKMSLITAVKSVTEWHRAYLSDQDMKKVSIDQIVDYSKRT
jgi:CDP-glucose 4,6-dehydratase